MGPTPMQAPTFSLRPRAHPPAAFDLTRRFSILSLVCVVVVATVLGWMLARMVSDRLLNRDAVLTMEFVQSVVRTDQTAHYFATAGSGVPEPLEDTFRHMAEMADVLRTNVYNAERRAMWSTDPAVMGKTFGANEELDEALQGELAFETGRVSKAEHVAARGALGSATHGYFIEIYVPVRDTTGAWSAWSSSTRRRRHFSTRSAIPSGRSRSGRRSVRCCSMRR